MGKLLFGVGKSVAHAGLVVCLSAIAGLMALSAGYFGASHLAWAADTAAQEEPAAASTAAQEEPAATDAATEAALIDEKAAQIEEYKEVGSDNVINERQQPDGSFLYETTIAELASADSYYDGMTVVITGEIMGDCINASDSADNCWLTIYSEETKANAATNSSTVYAPSSLEVYATKVQASVIDTYGEYNVKGSTVQIRGTFNLACAEHEGLSDIHAEQITVMQQGVKSSDTLSPHSFIPALIILAIAFLLILIYNWKQEGQR